MTPSRVSKTGSHVTYPETIAGYKEITRPKGETGPYPECIGSAD